MEATYRLKSSELNEDFIKMIKKLFKNTAVEITITSASGSKAKEEFLKAVEDVKLRKNLISFSPDEFRLITEKFASR